jgi:hypothetical protein
MKKQTITWLLMAFFSASLFAKDIAKDNAKNPLGCQNVGYQFDLNIVKLMPYEVSAKQSMYFFYNKSNQSIRLYHMRYEDSVQSTRLNNEIKPSEWGVLSTSEKQVKFLCAIQSKDNVYGSVVNCEEVIKVCEFPKVKYGLNNTGNYWLIDSTTRGSALSAVVRYGIIPAY